MTHSDKYLLKETMRKLQLLPGIKPHPQGWESTTLTTAPIPLKCVCTVKFYCCEGCWKRMLWTRGFEIIPLVSLSLLQNSSWLISCQLPLSCRVIVFEAQNQLWPDALPVVTNDFYWTHTQDLWVTSPVFYPLSHGRSLIPLVAFLKKKQPRLSFVLYMLKFSSKLFIAENC